jgi:DmsE family decaheme c-type cytochrome
MNIAGRILVVCTCICLGGAASPLLAEEPKPAEGQGETMAAPKDLVLKGDAVCTSCHDETEIYPVLAIGKTRHGVMADKNAPTCTTCHGESKSHLNIPKGEKDRPKPERLFGMRPTIPAELQVERYFGLFGKNTPTPVAERNAPCLECHQGDERIHWAGSAHETGDVACTSCHQIHTTHDRARDKHAQTEMCFACHTEQRAQMNRPSRHPIKEGKVACSDCHNPHGTAGPKLLVRDNVNDTCYQCHMEKRGPFVRSHEPVQEDCSICHNPHGTTNPNLLKLRSPFLCQSCHEPTSHHSTVPVDGVVGGANPSTAQAVIMARGCLNCHTQIHGSNNPVDGTGRGFRR